MKLGASAVIHDQPGQLFSSSESIELVEAITWTIITGTDALIIPRPTKLIIHFSHDDAISIHSNRSFEAFDEVTRLGLIRFSPAPRR